MNDNFLFFPIDTACLLSVWNGYFSGVIIISLRIMYMYIGRLFVKFYSHSHDQLLHEVTNFTTLINYTLFEI